jgi:alpha-1,3-rhamnosyl/mannosyltransferase
MMACGGAVIASTAGAVVETVGRHAHLVDPNDLVGWRDAMQRVITGDAWRDELARGATEVARPYTWERCARGTFQVYEEVLGKRRLMSQAA